MTAADDASGTQSRPQWGLAAVGGLGIAVAAALAGYAHASPGDGATITTLGFSALLPMKAWLTSAATALVIVQVLTALSMWGRLGRLQPAWAAPLHRWSGTLAFVITMPVVFHCVWSLGFATDSARTLIHSIAGCLFYGVFAAKMLSLRLRGLPGYRRVAVDSMGRVLGDDSLVESTPGDTLVTSIDAKVQSVVERQLAERIAFQRTQLDTVTGRRYAADSGAAVVLDAKTGRVIAMASQPTYDPDVWTGGITEDQLTRLYSEKAGTPLLSRATQGQFAPGSTWKPFMTAGALTNGYSMDTTLPCSSGFQVGNRVFKNYESGAYGNIGFAKALEVSCNTFFYRVGYNFWQRFGSDPADIDAKDPLVEEAKEFGFGSRTGIDLPGEAPGRIADRHWKQAYYESQKDYYCELSRKPQTPDTSDFDLDWGPQR